jgi:hypothetical protein
MSGGAMTGAMGCLVGRKVAATPPCEMRIGQAEGRKVIKKSFRVSMGSFVPPWGSLESKKLDYRREKIEESLVSEL